MPKIYGSLCLCLSVFSSNGAWAQECVNRWVDQNLADGVGVRLVVGDGVRQLRACGDPCDHERVIATSEEAAKRALVDTRLGKPATVCYDYFIFAVVDESKEDERNTREPEAMARSSASAFEMYLHRPSRENASAQAGYADEALGFFGQIVADRASNKAYGLAKAKLQVALRCSSSSKADSGRCPTPRIRFDATCRVLDSLRLQDIASSGTAFVDALTEDLLRTVLSQLDASKIPEAVEDGMQPLLQIVLRAVVHDSLTQPGSTGFVDARLLTDGVVLAMSKLKTETSTGVTVALAGVATFADCWRRFAGRDRTCNINKGLTEVFGKDLPPNGKATAHLIATELHAALALPRGTPGSQRVGRAANGVFTALCAALTTETSGATYTCPEPSQTDGLNALAIMALIRAMVSAIVASDTNRLISTAGLLVERVVEDAMHGAASEDDKDVYSDRLTGYQKGLYLAGTVAQYALTYREGNGQTGAQRQEARKAILESFTEEMTLRTGRGGDFIVSAGGSLRFVGGGRWDTDSASRSLWGPASLSLGMGFDKLFETTELGFHAEVGILELGNYLSWNEGLEVATPAVEDALGFSVMAGLSYGYELPIVFGPVFGYSPSVGVTRDGAGNDTPGSIFFGAGLGVYVPLFDFN